jgi:hypothetical protein
MKGGKERVTMATSKLEERVAALEMEVERLKAQVGKTPKRGWRAIVGTFANDPIYEEAMRLGKQWRDADRPKPTRKRKPRRVGA